MAIVVSHNIILVYIKPSSYIYVVDMIWIDYHEQNLFKQNICWRFVIFSGNDTFSRLSLLSELYDDSQTVAKDPHETT